MKRRLQSSATRERQIKTAMRHLKTSAWQKLKKKKKIVTRIPNGGKDTENPSLTHCW